MECKSVEKIPLYVEKYPTIKYYINIILIAL